MSLYPSRYDNLMVLNVEQIDQTPNQPVRISTSQLPPGVSLSLTGEEGLPDFTAMLMFSINGEARPGVYPLTIIGTAGGASKEYHMNLTVLPFNGFFVNGLDYSGDEVEFDTISKSALYARCNKSYYGVYLACTTAQPFPETDGTYTYLLDSNSTMPNTMQITYFDQNYNGFFKLKGATGKTAALTRTNGKFEIRFSDVTMSDVFFPDTSVVSACIHN